MFAQRSSGILLHPTSLPSRGGIGDLGPAAYEFVDWLAAAKQTLWQVLPLGPGGFGNSPYSCTSACAGTSFHCCARRRETFCGHRLNDANATTISAARTIGGSRIMCFSAACGS